MDGTKFSAKGKTGIINIAFACNSGLPPGSIAIHCASVRFVLSEEKRTPFTTSAPTACALCIPKMWHCGGNKYHPVMPSYSSSRSLSSNGQEGKSINHFTFQIGQLPVVLTDLLPALHALCSVGVQQYRLPGTPGSPRRASTENGTKSLHFKFYQIIHTAMRSVGRKHFTHHRRATRRGGGGDADVCCVLVCCAVNFASSLFYQNFTSGKCPRP